MEIEFIIGQPEDAKTITRLVCNIGHTDTLIADTMGGRVGRTTRQPSAERAVQRKGLWTASRE